MTNNFYLDVKEYCRGFIGGIIISFLTKKTVLYLLVLFMGVFLFCGAAGAATVNVNPGTGTIQAAVTTASAGDTLNLSAGTYNDHAVLVNKNLTITGPSVASGNPPTAVIDAQTSGRIFYINDGVTVTLQYLLLKNGYTDEEGGAVCNGGNLTVNSCRFTNNNADSGGGAITNEVTGTCKVTNSTFSSNNAPTNDGGAFYNYYGNASIEGCTFTSNTATDNGGAIYNYQGPCTVTNSTFNTNTATGGGAISNGDGGTNTVTDCSFTSNTATDGGAISNGGTGDSTIIGSTFTSNTATDGGAIYNTGTGNCAVTSCTLTSNNAGNDGGAIENYGGTIMVNACTFTINNAYAGGAINNYDGISTVTGSTFTGCTASFGGGISNYNIGVNTVNACTFTGNAATCGGAIWNAGIIWNSPSSTVSNSIFLVNTANLGGAIYNVGTITVTDSNFTSNNATYGGAFYESGGTCTITSSTFTANTANEGGAISTGGVGTTTVTACNFVYNTASKGKAIYTDNGDISSKIVNYNRFCGTTTGYEIYAESGSVNAMYNWWGSNSNPSTRVYGSVDVNPWLVLTVNATPSIIGKDSNSTITADLNHDSSGSTRTDYVIDGLPVIFSTTLGSINSPISTLNGVATATLHGGSVDGIARIYALLDSQIVSTKVTINSDSTPPMVTSTNPSQYAVNLPSNQVFTVTYSEPIKAGNLNLVVLKTSTGTLITTTKSITGNVLTITPTSALAEAKYLLMLYAGCVTDLAGNPSTATTRTYSVGVQPFVTTTNPANYAVNVPRNTAITATFNEPIVAKYLTLIYLKTAVGGILVPTTKSVSGNVLTITPTSPLAAGTRYMLLIYTFAVTDISGNSNVNKAISFTTSAT